jgi:50S ribosome-binding GTPase/Domain of unknown function (DUF3482)
MTAAVTIAISLVSHTNAGKTTLARTLLQRDVGEVRDAPHVTEFAEDHQLLRTELGDELRLWDTPGFGDSVRLVRRLRAQGNPVGWFLSEVWDRWRDRPFWASQQALRHVRDRTDVVLYLVNAAESPESAAYIEPEMDLLAWVGKPVIVLLNQLGAPREPAEEAVDADRWRRHLAPHRHVREILPMDAFARCWVQERRLLKAVQQALPEPAGDAMTRLLARWQAQRLATFERAMQSLAQSLGRIAAAREPLAKGSGLGDTVRQFGAVLGGLMRPGPGDDEAHTPAQRALASALDAEVRQGTAELIALHGLEGRAQGEILARVAMQFDRRARVDEGKAAVVGGMLTGALAGLKADIASGGLTMGGGLLAGGLLGALGAAGLARGINVMRGGGPAWVGWSDATMGPLVVSALLRYLAVAHFGRGRGQWAEGEAPAHWRGVVDAALATHQPALAALWKARSTHIDNPGEAEHLALALQPLLAAAARDALERLYPGSWPEAGAESPS